MIYSKIKTSSYDSILAFVHEALFLGLRLQSKAAQAREIEDILREIKEYAIRLQDDELSNPGDPVFVYLNNQYKDLVDNATSFLGKFRGSKGMSERQLFQRTSKGFKNTKAMQARGEQVSTEIFEQELASVFGALEFMSGDISANTTLHLVGNGSVNYVTSDVLNYEIANEFDKYVVDTERQIADRLGYRYTAKGLTVREGKPDVKGFNLEISRDIPINLQRLAELTKGANFSLKNYSTFKEIEYLNESKTDYNIIHKALSSIGINLGETNNLFKGVTGGFSEVDSNPRDILAFYYRGLNHLKWHGTYPDKARHWPHYTEGDISSAVEEHWAHLRLVYELRGSGMFYEKDGSSAVADYLVWNDPASMDIRVRDTGSLLYHLFYNSSDSRSLFGNYKINAGSVADLDY